jgi:hypothetical protein
VFLGRIGPEMQITKLCNYLQFVFRHTLAFPQIVCPGWNNNFYLEGVRLGQIFLQMPSRGTVSQVNQSSPARQIQEFFATIWIDLECRSNRKRAFLRFG